MDWQVSERRVQPAGGGIGSAVTGEAARGFAPCGVSDELDDPMVQVPMAPDRVSPRGVVALSCRIAGRPATKARSEGWFCEW